MFLFCSSFFSCFIVLFQSHNVTGSSSPKRTIGECHPPEDYSPGIQLGLVAVSASRSRPYPRAAGGGSGRQTAACLLVSFGLGRVGDLSHRDPTGVDRARDRNPDGPRPAASGLGSAGRWSVKSQRSFYRGLGPGRGPFGRGAPRPVKRLQFGVTGDLAVCATPWEHMAAANWISADRLKATAKTRRRITT